MNHIDQLIKEADSIIDGRREEPALQADDNETVKLASMLVQNDSVYTPVQASPETLVEKLAHAVAIVDIAVNFEQFQKLAQFQEQARSQGIPEEQIAAYLEKRAQASPSLMRWLTIPAAAAVGLTSHHLGKKKGYKKALEDVNQAFGQYAAQQQQPNE